MDFIDYIKQHSFNPVLNPFSKSFSIDFVNKTLTENNLKNFILYSFWLFYAIGVDSKILGNKIMSFLSGISLEIYLSHMFVFRFMEKLHVQYLFGEDNWVSYIILCSFTLVGLFALIFGYKLMVKLFKEKIFCRIMNKGESRESNEQ